MGSLPSKDRKEIHPDALNIAFNIYIYMLQEVYNNNK